MNGMGKRFYFALILSVLTYAGAHACGDGYVLVESGQRVDGIKVSECQKLWCMDFETGAYMGSGDKANSGYRATSGPSEICDATKKNCVTCWGERKWCAGEVQGEWNPEYGAYTRGGNNATYESVKKGSCFAWRLEKPNCEDGKIAVLQGDKWSCLTKTESQEVSRESSVRRTGSRRMISFK